jgi:membrane protease YdiL (CAAX protease family)
LKLAGSWERRGRNPLVGALVLVIGLGALYMLVQGLLLNGFILADLARRGPDLSPGRGLEAFAELYRRYRPPILAVLTATQFLIFLLLPLLVIRRWHTPDLLSYLGLRRLPSAGLLSLAGTLFLLPVSSGIAEWLLSFFPALARWSRVGNALIVDPRPWPLAATLLAIAVTPGLCEEVLFRGYLQRTLQRRLAFPWHFLLSGALFALFHQQVLSLPSLLLVGFFLGFVYHRFGSLYLTMLCHFLYNAVLILLANFPPRWPALVGLEGGFRWPFVAGSAALFAAAVAGMALLRRARS